MLFTKRTRQLQDKIQAMEKENEVKDALIRDLLKRNAALYDYLWELISKLELADDEHTAVVQKINNILRR